ncbi:MAG: hypothetical protein ACK56I_33285, partial [bacterium]
RHIQGRAIGRFQFEFQFQQSVERADLSGNIVFVGENRRFQRDRPVVQLLEFAYRLGIQAIACRRLAQV